MVKIYIFINMFVQYFKCRMKYFMYFYRVIDFISTSRIIELQRLIHRMLIDVLDLNHSIIRPLCSSTLFVNVVKCSLQLFAVKLNIYHHSASVDHTYFSRMHERFYIVLHETEKKKEMFVYIPKFNNPHLCFKSNTFLQKTNFNELK